MEKDILAKILMLRQNLHEHAEASEKETETQAILKSFLRRHTDLQIVEKGPYFYAVHKEGENLPNIAFRADMDAVVGPDGKPRHMCGHDGHSANLCALALLLQGQKVGKNVYLLFQHAEENGQGAKVCCEFLAPNHIDEIYGFHNIPDYPAGQILILPEISNCASTGITIDFTGKPSHAAYPELGLNPVFTIAELVKQIPSLLDPNQYQDLVLCTIVSCRVGDGAFGVSPAKGQLLLTVRAKFEEDLEKLKTQMEEFIKEKAVAAGLQWQISYQESFPETRNHLACNEKLKQICQKENLPYQELAEPFRWSEDYGYYTKEVPGCFFGIGDGEGYPQIHTENYCFPDEILPTAAAIFWALANAK